MIGDGLPVLSEIVVDDNTNFKKSLQSRGIETCSGTAMEVQQPSMDKKICRQQQPHTLEESAHQIAPKMPQEQQHSQHLLPQQQQLQQQQHLQHLQFHRTDQMPLHLQIPTQHIPRQQQQGQMQLLQQQHQQQIQHWQAESLRQQLSYNDQTVPAEFSAVPLNSFVTVSSKKNKQSARLTKQQKKKAKMSGKSAVQQQQQQQHSKRKNSSTANSNSSVATSDAEETINMQEELVNKSNLASSSNRFALLSDLNISIAPAVSALREQPNVNLSLNPIVNERSANAANTKESNKTEANASIRYCPPIVLYNVDIRSLVVQFKALFPDMQMKIINSSKTKSKLFLNNFKAYTEMMAFLKEKKISSHSFTPQQSRQISLILRGLHYLSDPEEIKAGLDVLLPGCVVSVQRFLSPFMKNNNITSDLFLVTLLPGKSVKDISAVKYLSYQSVTWEKPKSHAKEVQCKRCQRWGHIAKNCNHSYNCVKCDKVHEPGMCSLIKSADTEPYCINCKKFGHPANFRGCEAFKKFSDSTKVRKQINTSQNTRSSLLGPFPRVTSDRSYASHFKNNTAQGSKPNSKLLADFLRLAKEILESEPISLEDRMMNFIHNFKTMSPADKKSECLSIIRLLESSDE